MNQSYPNYEVILVDNGSTDGSVDYVQENFPTVKVIRNSENLGFCQGNNIGFRFAKGKYVIVLNNDTITAGNFIQELVKVAESDEKIGSVGCKIVQLDGSIKYGPAFTFKGFVQPMASPESVEMFSPNLANCGCAVLYRKSLIDKIGGFDPYFWSDWEDHDLGYRINLAGYKSVHTPRTYVIHLGGVSYTKGKPNKIIPPDRLSRVIRNMLFVHFKNYETCNLILRFPLFMLILMLKGIALPYFNEICLIIKKIFPNIHIYHDFGSSERRVWYLAFFKGFWKFLRDLKPIARERHVVQKMRIVSDRQIFFITQEKIANAFSRFIRIGS
jgi:GT2 family glycosyltransferase